MGIINKLSYVGICAMKGLIAPPTLKRQHLDDLK